jgi:hypothetical protein
VEFCEKNGVFGLLDLWLWVVVSLVGVFWC